MAFHKIDMETWPRREHFEYYSKMLKTSYQLNVDIDVTKLVERCKEQGLRFYPTMIHIIMRAVNHNENLRMALDSDGRLGYYDVCHPTYTIFHEDDKTFSDIWTEYREDFRTFYQAAVKDMEEYKDVKGIKAKTGRPDAYTPISCVPWVHFTGIGHDTPGSGPMYFPVITFGRFDLIGGKYLLPFSVFVNHAAADGYHSSMFVLEVERLCEECQLWMTETMGKDED